MHLLRPYGATLTSTLFSAAWPGLSTSPSARPPRTEPPFVPTLGSAGGFSRSRAAAGDDASSLANRPRRATHEPCRTGQNGVRIAD
jgi:hypothetical protein